MSIETISLSGSKKEVSNKKMTFWESLYLVAIIKGLVITISHLFTRKVTIKYPEEVRSRSDVYRGQHMLMRDDEGRERCTACGLCALSCPAEAITMKAAERTKDDLTTSKVLVDANYDREDFIYGKDKLVMPLDAAIANGKLKNAN